MPLALTIAGVLVLLGTVAIGPTAESRHARLTNKQLIRQVDSIAKEQIALDAKFRKKRAGCVPVRKAIKFYRGRAWAYQDELHVPRYPTLYPEKIPGRCGYLKHRAKHWSIKAKKNRKKLENYRSGSNYQRARHVIYATFPRATAYRALGVCDCETGGTYSPTIVNTSSGVTGLFQIHPGNVGTYWCWKGHGCMAHTSSTNLYDPWTNAKLALYMSKGGYDWTQWASVCRR